MNDPRLPARFWDKVQEAESGCWLWMGSLNNGGYGSFCLQGVYTGAHRHAYSALVGPIPQSMDLDHLCRVRHCVNPTHLEPVTRKDNLLRGVGPSLLSKRPRHRTHCKYGHAMTEENTYKNHGGRNTRGCKLCILSRNRKWKASANTR